MVGLGSLEDLPPLAPTCPGPGSTEPGRHGARHLAPYLPGAGSLDELDAELDG